MDEQHIEEFFGEAPAPPAKPARSLKPRLSFFFGVSRTSFHRSPSREQFYARVIGAAFLIVCGLSSAAATIAWSLQSGHALRSIWYVPLVWFPLVLTLELVIAVSIRPNMKGLVALLLAMRIGMSAWVGYEMAEPAVVYLNKKAVSEQVAKNIRNERATQIGAIRYRANLRIRKDKNARALILKRRRAKENAVHYWSVIATCAPGATLCENQHAYRLRRAQDAFAQEIENDSSTLASLNKSIPADQAKRDADIADAQKRIAESDDINAREHALGQLMRKSSWTWLFVWGLRFIFLAFDLTPCLSKIAIVRRGTVADKADEADEMQAAIVQKHRHATARAREIVIERTLERWPEFVDKVLNAKMQKLAESLVNDEKPKLVSVSEPYAAARAAQAAEAAEAQPDEQAALVERLQRALAAEQERNARLEQRVGSAVQVARHGSVPDGRFEWVTQLGRGSFSDVWLALDRKSKNAEVAVKLPVAGDELNELERGWIRAEKKILKGLDHPHIVHLLDTFEFADGTPALVLEYVPGTDLRDEFIDRFARGLRFSIPEALTFAIPSLAALDYLHGRGILHRDVTPANTVGWGSGESRDIRLTDFHVAAMIGGEPTKLIVGTNGYMSPEQLAGAELDARSDLYAVGVMIFEAISGERLFEERYGKKFTRERPPSETDIARLTDNIPFAKVLARSLSFDPAGRQLSARQLSDELRQAVGQRADSETARLAAPARDELEERRADPAATPRYEDDESRSAAEGKTT